jgi:hypothetical protein
MDFGCLLTTMCGLLATPDLDDPLVPEISQKYLEDYDRYVENAKLYTQRFATVGRPADDQLLFPEEEQQEILLDVVRSSSTLSGK